MTDLLDAKNLDKFPDVGIYTLNVDESNLPQFLSKETVYNTSHSDISLPSYNVNNLPEGRTHIEPERIVCAANQYKDHNGNTVVIAGVRHACNVMHTAFAGLNSGENIVYRQTEVQGFLTNKHRFVDRQEAWKIAVERQQIVCRVGGDTSKGGTLYSENLY